MFQKKTLIRLLVIVILVPLLGLIGLSLMSKRPANLGVNEGQLAPCPTSPNCVSSQSNDSEHGMTPIKYQGDTASNIQNIKSVMQARPRTNLITERDNYLHFEATSKILRFVDDIEFYIDEENQLIQFRSASRVGRSDMGVNRKRMNEIQQALNENKNS
ncbi:DUF1499 domain-containing protein [bacterium]|jgi:uncharacterized protein (DUF1499 family)|nr:DUF1499 domain-containing protein [Planctomicrobium sp.]MDA7503578.1 DUF1499 domain-containing protein [bacterium]